MPLVTEVRVDGYVSCIDPRCVGYEQRPVEVIRRTAAFTYRELGADSAVVQDAVERETVGVVQTSETCEHCGKPVIFSDQERIEYAPTSGQDPLELLAINQQTQIRDVQIRNAEQGREAAELKAQLAEMGRTMAEMQAELQRRKGGRPPKVESEEE
jgi:hypothetical protein